MKIKINQGLSGTSFRVLLFIALVLSLPGASLSAGPKKVAVLPFTINSDRDLGFLQEGIMDMLSSRLAWKGEVEILDKGEVKKKVAQLGGPVNKEKALQVGKALQVDYVIMGSLTVFGESVSIDAKIMDVAKSEELMTAFNQTKGMDEVIPTINQFAQDINAKIMGRVVTPSPSSQAAVPEEGRGPGPLIDARGKSSEGEVAYVQNFKLEIVGLDVGDVDGDGHNELVMISEDKVFIYKWTNHTLALFKEIEGGMSARYVYVSVGDMDRNGRAEIYVSNTGGSSLSSFVLEWQGDRFVKISEGQGWFFRVVQIPGQGKRLIGQERIPDGGFKGPVCYLKREGRGYVSEGVLELPQPGNVFNFALADLAGDGETYTVLLDPYERLALYDRRGERTWRSDDYFGGTLIAFEVWTGGGDEGGPDRYIFMPSPIFVTDVDKDREPEVVICSNHSSSGRLFQRMRNFSSGEVHFMTRDKVGGLTTKWTSPKLSGPIVGYAVSDLDNDGLADLVIAAVTREGYFLGKLGNARSRLVVYHLK